MHLDGYFSIIWKAVTLLILLTKNPLLYIVLLLGMIIMHYWSYIRECRECQSCGTTQFNNSNPTLDNLTQITIALCTYTHLHVDWRT